MKPRVLFIEDEKFLVEQLQIALTDYQIIPAWSAPKGMELIQEMDFDAILLDIMMPPTGDMDPELVGYGRSTGVELCRRIRALRPKLPIIVLSVVRDLGILNKIREAGANEIVNKPALPSRINEILHKYLDVHPSQNGGN